MTNLRQAIEEVVKYAILGDGAVKLSLPAQERATKSTDLILQAVVERLPKEQEPDADGIYTWNESYNAGWDSCVHETKRVLGVGGE